MEVQYSDWSAAVQRCHGGPSALTGLG